MSTRKQPISKAEISNAFSEGAGTQVPVILSTERLAQLIDRSPKTIYEWVANGYLDGSFRKRGKRHLFWRDRVLHLLFNGPDWMRDDAK